MIGRISRRDRPILFALSGSRLLARDVLAEMQTISSILLLLPQASTVEQQARNTRTFFSCIYVCPPSGAKRRREAGCLQNVLGDELLKGGSRVRAINLFLNRASRVCHCVAAARRAHRCPHMR